MPTPELDCLELEWSSGTAARLPVDCEEECARLICSDFFGCRTGLAGDADPKPHPGCEYRRDQPEDGQSHMTSIRLKPRLLEIMKLLLQRWIVCRGIRHIAVGLDDFLFGFHSVQPIPP